MEQIDAEVDHVAVAVPDFDVADRRWRDRLGGRWVSWHHRDGQFRSRQLRFRNGAKLELLTPTEEAPEPDNFVRAFLAKHGSRIHHLTLKVPELDPALDAIEAAGLDVVNVGRFGDIWHEAFLRPSQVGGLVVQVAWSGQTDEEWARDHDHELRRPPPDGATLEGPLLRHPELDDAARVWRLLGAEVTHDAGGLTCRWPRSAMTVRVVPGSTAEPLGLRFADAPALPGDEDLGAAVVAADD